MNMPSHSDFDATDVFFDALSRLKPFGAIDTSWKNDLCPSIGTDNVTLWIDYADPELRELECRQFCVTVHDDDFSVTDHAEFNDIKSAVAFFIAALS